MPLGPFTVIFAELGGGILTCVHTRDKRTSRMMIFPFADVINRVIDDNPAVLESVVLRDLRQGHCPPAVDRTMRPFLVAAVEIDAQPVAEQSAVGRDVKS